MIYEREFLNKRINELRKVIATVDECDQMHFLASKLLELYQFELRKYTRR